MSWSFFTNEGVEKIGEFGIVGVTGGDADTFDGLDSSMFWKKSETIPADTLEGYTASDFVLKAGDTMTGVLILSGNPALANDAANKSYVDTGDALKANLAGDTFTGAVYLPVPDPTLSTQATHKSYVDYITGLSVLTTGDTMTGFLILHADPTSALHAATKSYVDGEIDDTVAGTVAITGDTMTGALTLSADPTSALHAATKSYVDEEIDGTVAIIGDTMTGLLTLSADPTSALHAATKSYVDDSLEEAKDYTDDQKYVSTQVVTADHTATLIEQVFLVDVTAGPVEITLPSLAGSGKLYTIKHIAGDIITNAITIVDAVTGTIDGAATHTLYSTNEWVTVVGYSLNWRIIG